MEETENGDIVVPESCRGEDYFMDGCLDRMHFIIGQSGKMVKIFKMNLLC